MTVPVEWVQERLQHSPVANARKIICSNRTEFCNKLQIDYSVVYQTELGLYPTIPVTLLKAFKKAGLRCGEIQRDYVEFQKHERARYGELAGLQGLDGLSYEKQDGPITGLCTLLETTRTDLAKGLCIPTAMLYRLDRGKLKSFPFDLRSALRQAGVTEQVINELDKAQGEFVRQTY